MTLAILGIGTAVAPTAVAQEGAAAVAERISQADPEQASFLRNLFRNTGISTRHTILQPQVMADIVNGTDESHSPFLPSACAGGLGPTTQQRQACYIEAAPRLAVAAARSALTDAGVAADQITHLVTVSCTGFHAPGFDVALIQELGLPSTTQRTHIGFMGCHGALNALRVAGALANSTSSGVVLIASVEICSIHYQYGWNPRQVVANALFGDGAAALLGRAADRQQPVPWNLIASGSYLIPASENAMTWTIGDHGFVMGLSTRVPDLIRTHVRPAVSQWLSQRGLRLEDIGSWAVHPGGPRILEAVELALDLPRPATELSRAVLSDCGNMSSATVPFILERMIKSNAPLPCVAVAFGPGLTAELALFA